MKRQASVGMFCLYTMIAAIIIAALVSCNAPKGCNYKKAQKFNQKQARKYNHHSSVDNPENEEYVNEVAFNLGIDPEEVNQAMFDQRYNQ